MTALLSKHKCLRSREYKRLIRERLLIARNKISIAILFAGGKGYFPSIHRRFAAAFGDRPSIHRQAISLIPCSQKETRRPLIKEAS